jgi:Transposase DDE domain
LTTHDVNDVADARRIVGFYRLRWTVEQLFRTTKSKGFDIESLRQQEGGPLEKLVARAGASPARGPTKRQVSQVSALRGVRAC